MAVDKERRQFPKDSKNIISYKVGKTLTPRRTEMGLEKKNQKYV